MIFVLHSCMQLYCKLNNENDECREVKLGMRWHVAGGVDAHMVGYSVRLHRQQAMDIFELSWGTVGQTHSRFFKKNNGWYYLSYSLLFTKKNSIYKI